MDDAAELSDASSGVGRVIAIAFWVGDKTSVAKEAFESELVVPGAVTAELEVMEAGLLVEEKEGALEVETSVVVGCGDSDF
jgi:hypothetical protein